MRAQVRGWDELWNCGVGLESYRIGLGDVLNVGWCYGARLRSYEMGPWNCGVVLGSREMESWNCVVGSKSYIGV